MGEHREKANKRKKEKSNHFSNKTREHKREARDRRPLTLPALTLGGTVTVTNGTGCAATTAKHSTATDRSRDASACESIAHVRARVSLVRVCVSATYPLSTKRSAWREKLNVQALRFLF
jgi:hypothetical protein